MNAHHEIQFHVAGEDVSALREQVNEFLRRNPRSWNIGASIQLQPLNGRVHVLRLLDAQPSDKEPGMMTYAWEISGMGRVSNLEELKAAYS